MADERDVIDLLEAKYVAIRGERDKLQRIVELEKRAYDRLQLCSDHRDKATGVCIVCQAEHRTQEELKGERDEARQQRDELRDELIRARG